MFSSGISTNRFRTNSASQTSLANRRLTQVTIILVALMIGYWLGLRQSFSAESTTMDMRSLHVDGRTSKETSERKCTNMQREWQRQVFPAARARGCSAKDFMAMRIVHLHLHSSKAKLMIDVGSNKGYAAAEMFELFSPEIGISRKRLKNVYASKTFPEGLKGENTHATECGGCNECRDEIYPLLTRGFTRMCTERASQTTSSRKEGELLLKSTNKLCERMVSSYSPIHVYSFEANPDLTKALTTAIDHLSSNLHSAEQGGGLLVDSRDIPSNRFIDPAKFKLGDYWKVENLVITSKEHSGKKIKVSLKEGELGRIELVPFPTERVDDERSATFWVKPSPNAEMVAVDSTNLDEIIHRLISQKSSTYSHQAVDLLKIDVEGHDYDVVMGAMDSLSNHLVKVLKFEYGALWQISLESLITKLDSIQYACYFEGKNAMVKLTSNCWSDALESKFWSNVWCLSLHHAEGLAIANAFDALSLAFI